MKIGGDAMKIVKMTTQDLEYYINLVDKAVAGCERIDSIFERSSTMGKMLPNSIACYRGIFYERKSQSMQQTSQLSILEITTATPTFSNHHPDQSAAINIKAIPATSKRLRLAEGSDDG